MKNTKMGEKSKMELIIVYLFVFVSNKVKADGDQRITDKIQNKVDLKKLS